MEINRKNHGIIYGKGTAEGFDRMKKKGAILPPFNIQDNVTRILTQTYAETFAEFDKIIAAMSLKNGAMIADAMPPEFKQIISRLKTVSMVSKSANVREMIDRQLLDAEQYFFKNFLDDAPDRISIRVQFGLEADKVFQGKLETLREEYLDTAMDRISEGESWLRLGFITELYNWAEGKGTLDSLPNIMANVKKESGAFSQFFSRDQFSRFNRALTTASFKQAGINKFKWMSVNDQRTRRNHHLLHNHVFDLDNPPEAWKAPNGVVINVREEMNAYNCRCACIPVFD
jgi:SPP1 gp7 family putative phage head morphogenesis protein